MKIKSIISTFLFIAGSLHAQRVTMSISIDADFSHETIQSPYSWITTDFTPSFYSGISSIQTISAHGPHANLLDSNETVQVSLEFRSPQQAENQYIVIQKRGVNGVYRKTYSCISHLTFPQNLSKALGLMPEFNLVYTSLE